MFFTYVTCSVFDSSFLFECLIRMLDSENTHSLTQVPALTFHNVETLSDGLTWSVSTWTHNMTLYHTMQAIYEINVMPDKLKSLEGRVFALRLFLDVLLYEIVGNDVSSKYISDMITSRYETVNQKMGENEAPIWKKYVVF